MNSRRLLKPFLLLFALVTTVFTTTIVTGQIAEAKELTNVINSITVRDGNLRAISPDANNVYNFGTNNYVNFGIDFDLSAYDNQLRNGDTITFTIPEGMTVLGETIPLVEAETQLKIGTIKVTANGPEKGGVALVTLSDLEKYAQKKLNNPSATEADVTSVAGNFKATFKFETDQDTKTYDVTQASVKSTATRQFTFKTRTNQVADKGQLNWVKNGGKPERGQWDSPALAAIGAHPNSDNKYSAWFTRINVSGQTWTDGGNENGIVANSLTIVDEVATAPTYSDIKIIPESFKIYSGTYATTSSSALTNPVLVDPSEYDLVWNANYTGFTLVLKNPDLSYYVSYHTTTPGDGSIIGNYIKGVTAGDTAISQWTRDAVTRYETVSEFVSTLVGEATADVSNRVRVRKIDAITSANLSGGVFRITSADGTFTQEITTDNTGYAITDRLDPSYVGQVFTVEEITPPTGYELAKNPKVTVKLEAQGTTLTFRNQPVSTRLNITATKDLQGLALKDDQFTAVLLNDKGLEVARATNKNGTWTFADIPFSKPGTHNYSIKEINTGLAGVTYDTTSYPVTVEVTQENASLVARVTSAPVTITNTYKASPATAQVKTKKTLRNRQLTADEFTFVLADEQGTVQSTVKNNAAGEVVFPNLTFTQTGTYRYTIKEQVPADVEDIRFDTKTINVTVTVTDNGKGKLVSKVDYDQPTGFVNEFIETLSTQLDIRANKSLKYRATDGTVSDDVSLVPSNIDFNFTLTDDADSTRVYRASVTGNGEIVFANVPFTKAGRYTFTLREEAGTSPGVVYSAETPKVYVDVTRDRNTGQLTAALVREDGSADPVAPTIQNYYTPEEAKATLSATKILDGRALQAGEFEFVLTDQTGTVVETVRNAADGAVNFTTLSYNKAGVYTYTITENNTNSKGITYDTSSVIATVNVADKGTGKLEAIVSYRGDDQTFENSYKPAATQANIAVNKTLSGRDLAAGEFEFVLTDQAGTVVERVTNAADGSVAFAALTYDQAGVYNYTITETNNGLGGVTYDATPIAVTVTVTDDAAGQLVVEVAYGNNDQRFENTYAAAPTSANFSATKTLTGRTLQANEFSFVLKDANSTELQTVTNAADGTIAFDAINFDKAGTYVFTITEKAGNLAGVTYDTSSVTATVEVADDGKGQLSASVTYSNGDQTFENTYAASATTAAIKANKTLSGRELKADEFEFVLADKDGNVVEVVKNAADGSVIFSELPFNAAGEYSYTITEKAGNAAGVTYDTSVVSVLVSVKDNGAGQLVATVSYGNNDQTFENSYKPIDEPTPPTDEPTPSTTNTPTGGSKTVLPSTGEVVGFGLVGMIGCGLMALAIFLLRRKKA